MTEKQRPAPTAVGNGPEGQQDASIVIATSDRTQASKRFLAAQLKLFTIRAVEIFQHVLEGRMLLLDATDLLHDASVASGLSASVGDDAIQKLLVATLAAAAGEAP